MPLRYKEGGMKNNAPATNNCDRFAATPAADNNNEAIIKGQPKMICGRILDMSFILNHDNCLPLTTIQV